jgi:hypothetical protein
VSVSFVNVDGARLRAQAGVALLASALALAACGDDDEPTQTTAPAVTGATQPTDEDKAPGTSSPEDELSADPATDKAAIGATLDTVLTSDSAKDVCGDLVTERYLRRSYGDAAGCERAQQDAKPARDVGIGRIVILPDSLAQASARPDGGIYDGERLRAELVLDGGVWKLDSLRSNVPVGP